MNIYTLRFLVLFLSIFFHFHILLPKDYQNSSDSETNLELNSSKKLYTPIKKLKSTKKMGGFASVTASYLNLRKSPIIGKNIITLLPKRSHLIILSQNHNGWVKVRIPNSVTGWVYANYLDYYKPKAIPLLKNNRFYNSYSSSLEGGIIEYMNEIYSKNILNKNDKLFLVIQDLDSDKFLASIRSKKIIKSASTIKVPILHAYMIQRFKGNIIESPWEKKLIEEMIRYSSNPSANSVIHLLGGTKNIQNLLNKTKIYRELSLVEYFPVDGRAYQNKISVADLNSIFTKIWNKLVLKTKNNHKINKDISEEILFLLSLPGYAWIKDRIKDNTCFSSDKTTEIWDKTGFVKGSNGNAAIVRIDTPHGKKAYSIVLFIERNDYKSIKGDAKIWYEKVSLHMRRISEMTYAFFSRKYERNSKCGLSRLLYYTKLAQNKFKKKIQKNF